MWDQIKEDDNRSIAFVYILESLLSSIRIHSSECLPLMHLSKKLLIALAFSLNTIAYSIPEFSDEDTNLAAFDDASLADASFPTFDDTTPESLDQISNEDNTNLIALGQQDSKDAQCDSDPRAKGAQMCRPRAVPPSGQAGFFPKADPSAYQERAYPFQTDKQKCKKDRQYLVCDSGLKTDRLRKSYGGFYDLRNFVRRMLFSNIFTSKT